MNTSKKLDAPITKFLKNNRIEIIQWDCGKYGAIKRRPWLAVFDYHKFLDDDGDWMSHQNASDFKFNSLSDVIALLKRHYAAELRDCKRFTKVKYTNEMFLIDEL